MPKSKKVLVSKVLRRTHIIAAIPFLALGVLLSFASCREQRKTTDFPESVDLDAARRLSDAVANDVVNQRSKALREKSEELLRSQVDEAGFAAMLDQMYEAYGTPMEVEFKQVDRGNKTYADGQVKDMKKFWYAVRTSKAEKGTYFLFVEVVNDKSKLAFSSFAIVRFQNEVPPNLR